MDNLFESRLTANERKELDESLYGLPKERKYPMPDEEHVRKAIQFFGHCDPNQRGTLAKNIRRRMEELGLSMDVSKTSAFYPYSKMATKESTETIFVEAESSLGKSPIDTKGGIAQFQETIWKKLEEIPPSEYMKRLSLVLEYISSVIQHWEYQKYSGMIQSEDCGNILYLLLYDIIHSIFHRTNPYHESLRNIRSICLSADRLDHFYMKLFIRILEEYVYHETGVPKTLEKAKEELQSHLLEHQEWTPYRIDKKRFYSLLMDSITKSDPENVPIQSTFPLTEKYLQRNSETRNDLHPYIISPSVTTCTEEGTHCTTMTFNTVGKHLLKELEGSDNIETFLRSEGFTSLLQEESVHQLLDHDANYTVLRRKDVQPTIESQEMDCICFQQPTDEILQMVVCQLDTMTLNKVTITSEGVNLSLGACEPLFGNEIVTEMDPTISTEGISLNPDGSLRFTLFPKRSFMDAYMETHRALVANHKAKNIAGMKDNLCSMFTLIATIERDVMYSKREVSPDDRKVAMDARAAAINDFKTYLKAVQEVDKNFDFLKYYQDSDYGKLVFHITPASIRGMKKLLSAILL